MNAQARLAVSLTMLFGLCLMIGTAWVFDGLSATDEQRWQFNAMLSIWVLAWAAWTLWALITLPREQGAVNEFTPTQELKRLRYLSELYAKELQLGADPQATADKLLRMVFVSKDRVTP